MVDHTDVIPSVLSDHSIIQLSVRNPKLQPRGPGYWKFNTTLLRDKQYIKHIKQCIIKSEALHQYDDKAIEWELIKMDKDPLQYHTANIKNKKASNTKHI
jgi:hypothetical protein